MRVMGRGPLWMTMCRGRGRSVGVNVKTCLGCRQNAHARPAVRAHLNCERSLKNLFEQITLVHGGWRTDAQALALLEQHDLVGVLAGEVELVRDDYHGVALFRRGAAKRSPQLSMH